MEGREKYVSLASNKKGKEKQFEPTLLVKHLKYKKSMPSTPIFLPNYDIKIIEKKIVIKDRKKNYVAQTMRKGRKNNLPSAPNLFAPGKPSEPLGDLLRN